MPLAVLMVDPIHNYTPLSILLLCWGWVGIAHEIVAVQGRIGFDVGGVFPLSLEMVTSAPIVSNLLSIAAAPNPSRILRPVSLAVGI